MTVDKSPRAISTPSPVLENLKTPDSMLPSAGMRRMSATRAEARKKHKVDMDRRLKNDLTAMSNARRKEKKSITWNLLSDQQQEQTLEKSALDALQLRKENGLHVSCVYPIFADYVFRGRRGPKDEEKDYLMYKQLDLLERQGLRSVRDEESDDEEPNPLLKKEGGEETPALEGKSLRQHMREIEALRQRLARFNEDTKTALPTPKQRSSTRTTTPPPISDTTPR